jgi:hypothetical protein
VQGRRIPVVDNKADPYLVLEQPGDYYGPVMGFSADRPAVFYFLPIGEKVFAGAQSPPHTFTEELDGSLTIRGSILTRWSKGSWHGFLTKGIWSTC